MRIIIIYKVTNVVNNKIYVGQTSLSLLKRKNSHFLNAFKKNINYKFYNALRKYGWNSFTWDEIDTCDITESDARETYWIQYYNSNQCGYNMTDGGRVGSHGRICNQSTKNKIASANKGKIRTTEMLNRLSIACSGKNNGMYGKTHTNKSKKVMSDKAHIRYTGKGNPCAKLWTIISPNGIEYKVHGELKKFCINHNIIMSLLKKFKNGIVDITKLKLIHARYMAKTQNTNGWSLFEITA